ncbi:MAG: hypothetical protein KDC98_00625 [Planctomycetes bacterium]|nr:hypothetical protein [Planctomycetota bacterium]
MISVLPIVRRAGSLLLGSLAIAQVPDGYVVFGSFQGATGQNGVYFAHPRDTTAPPIEVTGLPSCLSYDPLQSNRGVASLLRRPGDDMLIVGEHAPAGTVVDVHVLTLDGAAVVQSRAFPIGTSVVEGEVPQMGLLPDGRVVLAATDLAAGSPLSQFLTVAFNWEGVGILDTSTGSLVPILIANLDQFPGVINGLAVTPDGQTVYVGNWISTTSGDLWSVPIGGGAATMVAALPGGVSNIMVDEDRTVLVTTLNGPPNLFRYDPGTGVTVVVPTTSGPLNAIVKETVTGNTMLVTANAGIPVRSLVWRDPGGAESLLMSPNRATISAVDINHNPERYGQGTPGVLSYDWLLSPNPTGLPEVGNVQFSLTMAASRSTTAPVMFLLSLLPMPPTSMFGLSVVVDPTVAANQFVTLNDTAELSFPLPPAPGLIGIHLFAQGFVYESATNTLAASPGAALTIL